MSIWPYDILLYYVLHGYMTLRQCQCFTKIIKEKEDNLSKGIEVGG